MKHFFIALLSIITVSAFGQRHIVKSFYEDQDITGLVVNGAFEVKIKQGEKSSVKITTKENLFDKIQISISDNGVVNLTYGTEVGKFFKYNKPLVEVIVSQLDMLSVGGAVDVIGSGEFSAKEVSSISVDQNGFLEFLTINAPKVDISSKGAATVREITITSPDVKVTTSGASLMMVRGECDKMVINTNNSSSLDALLMESKRIDATCFGVSAVKAMVNGTANVNVGPTALFRYMGDGEVTGKASRL